MTQKYPPFYQRIQQIWNAFQQHFKENHKNLSSSDVKNLRSQIITEIKYEQKSPRTVDQLVGRLEKITDNLSVHNDTLCRTLSNSGNLNQIGQGDGPISQGQMTPTRRSRSSLGNCSLPPISPRQPHLSGNQNPNNIPAKVVPLEDYKTLENNFELLEKSKQDQSQILLQFRQILQAILLKLIALCHEGLYPYENNNFSIQTKNIPLQLKETLNVSLQEIDSIFNQIGQVQFSSSSSNSSNFTSIAENANQKILSEMHRQKIKYDKLRELTKKDLLDRKLQTEQLQIIDQKQKLISRKYTEACCKIDGYHRQLKSFATQKLFLCNMNKVTEDRFISIKDMFLSIISDIQRTSAGKNGQDAFEKLKNILKEYSVILQEFEQTNGMYCAKNRNFNHLVATNQITVRVSNPARERWLKLQRYLMPAMRFKWVKNHNQKKEAQLRRHKMEKLERILKEFDITRIEEDYILPVSGHLSRANSNLINSHTEESSNHGDRDQALTPTNEVNAPYLQMNSSIHRQTSNIEQEIANYISSNTPVNLPATFNNYDNPAFSQMSNFAIDHLNQNNQQNHLPTSQNNNNYEIVSPRNPGNSSAFFSQDISRRLFSSESNLNRLEMEEQNKKGNCYQSTQTLNNCQEYHVRY